MLTTRPTEMQVYNAIQSEGYCQITDLFAISWAVGTIFQYRVTKKQPVGLSKTVYQSMSIQDCLNYIEKESKLFWNK